MGEEPRLLSVSHFYWLSYPDRDDSTLKLVTGAPVEAYRVWIRG